MCDICISAEELKQVSAEEMRIIVENGFDPFSEQLVNEYNTNLWSKGLFNEIYIKSEPRDFTPANKAALQNWKRDLVDIENNSWHFCSVCANAVEKYYHNLKPNTVSNEEYNYRNKVFNLATGKSICWFCGKGSGSLENNLRIDFSKNVLINHQTEKQISNIFIPRCNNCKLIMKTKIVDLLNNLLTFIIFGGILVLLYGLLLSENKIFIVYGFSISALSFILIGIVDLVNKRSLVNKFGLINYDYKDHPDYKEKISSRWIVSKIY